MEFARLERMLQGINPSLADLVYRWARRIPAVARRLDTEYDAILAETAERMGPVSGSARPPALPEQGHDPDDVIAELTALRESEAERWRAGYASGAVYHGSEAHVDLLNRAYALHSQSNPLHADLWPGTVRLEAEIVAMTASLLHGEGAVGAVTSGGTESILLAMKAYRDSAADRRRIKRPEVVLPVTAHVAFDKACGLFGILPVRVPVDASFRADPGAVAGAIGRNTVAVIGSAPSFPHGTIDPIEEMSEIARRRRVGFHTDACLGGFLLPWAERLGYDVPGFDFRLPGVTSMSADTHKYGYAAKGTSVVLYRDRALRRYQYFTAADWPGGLYASSTLAGSRPGGLSAACWAAMVTTGEQGYLEATRRILETAAVVKRGIDAIPGLRVLGDPLWVIAFTGTDIDIYRVAERMTDRGWSLNGLQHPPAVHLAVTLRHAEEGVADRFLADLAEAAAEARESAADAESGVPLYGMAASFPVRGAISDLLERYLDLMSDG